MTMLLQVTRPLSPKKHYDSPGRCIYCHDPAVVGDEHIIAEGLGGGVDIRQASCRRCERVTSRIETACIGSMLNIPRTHMGIVGSRHPRGREPRLPVWVQTATQATKQNVLLADHPLFLMLVALPTPEILLGVPPSSSNVIKGARFWRYTDPKGSQKAQKLGADSLAVHTKFHVGFFCQMLAKIAHSFAVAKLGLDAFEPLLPAFIHRTEHAEANYLVGGSTDQPPPAAAVLHQVQLFTQNVDIQSRSIMRNETYVVARVRLFANLGAPNYYAVVGKPKGSWAISNSALSRNSLFTQPR